MLEETEEKRQLRSVLFFHFITPYRAWNWLKGSFTISWKTHCIFSTKIKGLTLLKEGHTVAQMVGAQCYQPESCWLESRQGHWIFQFTRFYSRTMVLGLTHPVTEMSAWGSSWGVKRGRSVRLRNSPRFVIDFLDFSRPSRLQRPVTRTALFTLLQNK
jgi:hypothetical protein